MGKRPDELVRAIKMPRRPGGGDALHYYRKVGTRKAQAIAKVGLAALGRLDRGPDGHGIVAHVRIALASVGPTVLTAVQTEAAVLGHRLDDAVIAHALAVFDTELTPIDDVRSTERYRRTVASNLVEDFLRALGGRA
jgi:CO/xanthine dehydrogenase FAD-binding subunit